MDRGRSARGVLGCHVAIDPAVERIEAGAFGVVAEEHVFPRRVDAAHGTHIILVPVGVASMEVEQDIVDVGIEVQILLDGVQVARLCRVERRLPTAEDVRLLLGRCAFDDFDPISADDAEPFPVVVFSAEALGGPFLLDAFEEVVHSPVDAVEIDVHLALQSLRMPHGEVGIAKPLVADIHRVIVDGRVRMDPRVAVAAAKHDLVEAFGGRVAAEEREVQSPSSILVAEGDTKVVFRSASIARGVSIHAHAGVEL